MNREEIIKQLDAMENEAKKLIDNGEDKASFMFGISDAAANLADKNLGFADFIVREAKVRVANIAKYNN